MAKRWCPECGQHKDRINRIVSGMMRWDERAGSYTEEDFSLSEIHDQCPECKTPLLEVEEEGVRSRWRYYRFRGMNCFIHDGRPSIYPAGKYHFYSMRHGDTDWASPLSIEPVVLVNFWGVIGTPHPLVFPSKGHIDLTPEESESIANLFA